MYFGSKIYGLPIHNYDNVPIKTAPFFFRGATFNLRRRHSLYPNCVRGIYQKSCPTIETMIFLKDKHR